MRGGNGRGGEEVREERRGRWGGRGGEEGKGRGRNGCIIRVKIALVVKGCLTKIVTIRSFLLTSTLYIFVLLTPNIYYRDFEISGH